MAKTNYTKVEEMLNEGLRKMSVNHLLDQSEAVTQSKKEKPTEQSTNPLLTEQTLLMAALQHDFGALQKQGRSPYEKLGIKKSYLKKIIENSQGLTPQEWEEVKKFKSQLDDYKKELAKNLPQTADEDLIEAERRSHKTKRFNTNKNWLPLH